MVISCFFLPLQLHISQMLSKEALQKGVWKQTPYPHENASSLYGEVGLVLRREIETAC